MIYIQSNTERTIPHHFDAACAMYGAIGRGQNYRLTAFDEVASGRFDSLIRSHLFVGSVEFMREVFKRVGLTDVRVPANSNRPSERITLKEAHRRVAAGEKLFVKPVEIKLFTGLVLDGIQHSCLTGLPEDTEVLAYKPFSAIINSEWRAYIHNHEVTDIRNYAGSFFEMADAGYLHEVTEQNKKQNFPCAYTIDIAVLNDYNRDSLDKESINVVVEFNDMWAIGNYGVPNDLYLRLLSDRYFEIMRN